MSRPVVLATVALGLGIIAADRLFYENLIVPAWLEAAMWGFALLTALGAWLCWRFDGPPGSNGAGMMSRRLRGVLFSSLISVFFLVFGFARYAAYSADVQASWQAMERPPVNRGNPDEFDYVRWRWIQGVEDTTAWTAQLRRRALIVREHLLETFASVGMDREAQAIVSAATLGDRSQLSHETRDLYAAAGASHLLALSGLHLSIIVGFFLTLLNGRLLLSPWRPWLAVAVFAFIWTFAFIAGLPTSLVRASLMTSLFLAGSLLRRFGHPLHWLVLTALVMLLIRPVYLFDVGAQLSFAAVAGIVVLHRRWYMWFFEHYRFLCFRLERYHLMWPFTVFSVSLSAQLFTLPLVACFFHRIPFYAPLFNLVFIPLTTALIYGALALLIVSSLSLASLSALLGRALSWIVAAQIAVMHFEVSLPGAVVNDFWSRKAEPQVVVYNNWRCPALHVIASPDTSWLLTPEPDSIQAGMRYIAESFWRRRLTSDPVVLEGRQAVAIEGGFKAVMIDSDGLTAAHATDAGDKESIANIDVLWITKGFRGESLDGLVQCYRPRLLVLDASLSPWQRAALRDDAARVGWCAYDVAEQGALRLRLSDDKDY